MSVSDRKSQNVSVFIGIVLVIVVIALIFGVWILKSQSEESGMTRSVTYQVEATGGYAVIVYTDSSGKNTDSAMVTTPFNRTVTLPVGHEVYLTASNPSQTGSISCMIKIDNRDWKSSRGQHPVDSVACGGIVK